MNDHDKEIYFRQIFMILKPRLEDWTMFQVLQFLVIIKSPFSDMVRKHSVNGKTLVNLTKIQRLFAPQLTAQNILPYLKMLIIVQQLKSPGPSLQPLKPANSRPRPRSMMFQQKLLRTIRVNMQRVTDKPLILWTSDNILDLLTFLHFQRFTSVVKSARIDGFILICVASDWDCLLRLRSYMQDSQIREINFVSQVLVAENYFCRYFEEEDISDRKVTQEEIGIAIVKADSRDFQREEEQENGIMEKSAAEKLMEENDFFLAYSEMGKSGVKQGEELVKLEKKNFSSNQFQQQGFMSHNSLEKENGNGIHMNRSAVHSLPKLHQTEQTVTQSKDVSIYNDDDLPNSELPSSQLPNSELPNSQIPQNDYAENYQDKSVIRASHMAESKLAESQLAESKLAESQLAESQYGESQYAESQYGKSVVQSQYGESVILDNGAIDIKNSIEMSSLEQPLRLNQLKAVTLSMPFDLLSFESLHWISLVEVSDHSKQQMDNKNYRSKTFSIKGVKFGRDKQNDFSYPDELSISSKHALILFKDENFYLQDLGSKTGTFKQIISKIELCQDMCIQLSHVVEFTIEKISKKDGQGLIKIAFQKPQSMPVYEARFKKDVKLSIGRSEQCTIAIDNKKMSISMRHAQILFQHDKFFFIDCSQNGSWIRLSQKSQRSQPLKLQKGDRFRLSSKKIFLVNDIKTLETLY